MSPDERAALQASGVIILVYFAALTPFVLLHGVFIMLMPFCTFTLLQRGLASRSTQAMLGTTLITFLLSSFSCASAVSNAVISIRETILHFTGTFQEDSERMFKSSSITSSIQDVTMMLMPIVNDGVMIWRAWVLYPDKQWIMLVPCAFLFGTIGATFAYLVLDVKVIRASSSLPFPWDLAKAFLTLSLGTNVTATSLIFYKLWSHLRFLRRMGIKQNSTSPVQKVLIMLVESGLAYCAFQITFVVLGFQYVSSSTLSVVFATNAFWFILMPMTAMYPSIVILLVSLQRSTAESFIFSTQVGRQSAAVQDIEFASAHPASLGHLSDAVPVSLAPDPVTPPAPPTVPTTENEASEKQKED